MTDAASEEITHAQRTVERSNKLIQRLVLAGIALVITVAITSFVFVDVEVAKIRGSQIENTTTIECQNKSFDQILAEAAKHEHVQLPPKC